jgi:hypothetical protein
VDWVTLIVNTLPAIKKHRSAVLFMWGLPRLAGYFFQHFDADLTRSDFAQSGHAWLVLAFHLGGVALAEHARAIRGAQHQLKAVRDLLEAIFNSDAGHVVTPEFR